MDDEEFRKHVCVYLKISCEMLADNEDQVIVDYTVGDRTTLFRIQSTCIGPILGKKGRLINAIRAITIAAGHKNGMRCAIDLVEYSETSQNVS